MVSYRNDILPRFIPRDFTCMDGFGWPLGDVDFMIDPAPYADHADYGHARETLARLSSSNPSRRMPKGRPPWPPADIDLFARWIEEGCAP